MHPGMLLKGNQANFTDPDTGDEVRPKGYAPRMADFVVAINRAGFKIAGMQEYSGTAELAAQFPKAEKYLHWPMLVTFNLELLR